MEHYKALVDATRLVVQARQEVSKEDGVIVTSPAWVMLHHAAAYLDKQAHQALRGDA